MSGRAIVMKAVEQMKLNQVFFAGQIYREELSGQVTEAAFYKTIERFCKEGILSKVAQGTYCRPKMGRFGVLPPSETEIVKAFTKNQTGMTIGYSLYNSLYLTTQIGKNIEVLTSRIEQGRKTIGNVRLMQCMVEFEPDMKSVIQMLEILLNYAKIQDLNVRRFLAYAEAFSRNYSDEAFRKVYLARRYPKRVIAFLAEILNYYGATHGLDRYLSALSEYKHPKMEALYESAWAKK